MCCTMVMQLASVMIVREYSHMGNEVTWHYVKELSVHSLARKESTVKCPKGINKESHRSRTLNQNNEYLTDQ